MNDENEKPKDNFALPPTAPLNESPLTDFDKTNPNLDISQEDRSKTTPIVDIPPAEKSSEWQMPPPVFGSSSGKKYVSKAAQNQPQQQTSAPDVSNEQENFIPAAPDLTENVRETAPMPSAQPQIAAPVTKKSSKLPLILGSSFALLILGGAALAGVYFFYLKNPEIASTADSAKENTNVTTNKTESASTNTTAAAPAAKTEPGLPKEIDFKGNKMMLVAAVSLTMGSNTGEGVSKPAHQDDLPAFYIDKTEVTNLQYKEFCDATGKNPPDSEKDDFKNRPDAPVVGISFEDAKAYAAWAGKRLPTDKEWEKAVSSDEAAKLKREFPWGSDSQKENAAFGFRCAVSADDPRLKDVLSRSASIQNENK